MINRRGSSQESTRFNATLEVRCSIPALAANFAPVAQCQSIPFAERCRVQLRPGALTLVAQRQSGRRNDPVFVVGSNPTESVTRACKVLNS